MKKIILDTNFLIDLIKFKLDVAGISDLILEPYKLYTINSVVNELKILSSKKSKEGKIALQLFKKLNVKILNSKTKNVDKAIIQLADNQTIVATNDTKLRKKLKSKKVKTIYLRAKKHLAIS